MSFPGNIGLPPRTEMTLQKLFSGADHVGGVFSPGHEKCQILTNDKWTQDAGGLPKHSLLIARPLLEGDAIVSEDDVHKGHRLPEEPTEFNQPDPQGNESTHALLLRVTGPADIPQEGRLQTNRYDAIREAITGDDGGTPSAEDFVDVLTRREMQYSGIETKILGTFYYDENENGDKRLSFSSDVQTFFSAGHYVVHKPDDKALQWIASYPTTEDTSPVKLGDVRYTTTNIWDDATESGMYFDVEEFIGAKTAVFGMTRKGKSNTMKIIAGAIEDHDESVGQLIFDPSGEYAYKNQQDNECALGELHDSDGPISTVYKFAAKDDDDRYKPLRSNLLAHSNLNVTKQYVQQELAGEDADYIGHFRSTSADIPSENDLGSLHGSDYRRARWLRSAYYAVISKAIGEDSLPEDFDPMYIGVNSDVLEVVNNNTNTTDHSKSAGGDVPLEYDDGVNTLVDFWETVAENIDEVNEAYEEDHDWVDDDLESVLKMLQTSGSKSGWRKLTDLSDYHSPKRDVDVANEIYQKLASGELVVVDISNGLQNVITAEKERLVGHILKESMQRFRELDEDESLPKIQLYLEEAHQHFDEYDSDRDEMNPFVTLAKEGAKFEIGLAYATQEVTSVDARVRANTANWIVTHINSGKEIRELGEYYNFSEFGESIRNVEDVGYARAKTYSGEYIVPVMVSLFDKEWVRENTQFGVKKDGEFVVKREGESTE